MFDIYYLPISWNDNTTSNMIQITKEKAKKLGIFNENKGQLYCHSCNKSKIYNFNN